MDGEGFSSHASESSHETLVAKVVEATGASPLQCYQCGRCAAGCPQNVAGEMDLSPTRVMRLLQLEEAFATQSQQAVYTRQALGADTPWLCAGCMACTTRCPQGVDIAGTMDVLRQEGLRRGMASTSKRARDIQALHRTFLESALSTGRIHEVSLVMRYKLRTWNFFQDAILGTIMFLKGKLSLKPGPAQDMSRVQNAIGQLRQQKGSAEA